MYRKEVESVHGQIQITHSVTEKFVKDMAQRNSDASLKHRNDMQSAQKAIDDLRSLLSNVKNGDIKSIITAVTSLHEEIVSTKRS